MHLCADFEEGASGTRTPGLNHPVYGTTAIAERHVASCGRHLRWHHLAALSERSTGDYARRRPAGAGGQHLADCAGDHVGV